MADLTTDLPYDLHDQFLTLAEEAGLDAEDLARQLIILRVGVNSSLVENTFSSVLLQTHHDDILVLAESGPVFVRDKTRGDFVITTYERYEGPESAT